MATYSQRGKTRYYDVHVEQVCVAADRPCDGVPHSYRAIHRCRRFWDMAIYWSKIADLNLPHIHLAPCWGWVRYTLCLKNDTALACYNFDKHQPILILFGKNVDKKVRSQMVLLFFRLTYLVLLHYLAKHGNTKIASFLTQMLYYCFSRVQPVAAWFLQFCWLETHIVADMDSQNLIINWVQLWPVGAIAQEKWSWEFCAAAVKLCCTHHALVHAWAVLLKGK